MNLVHGRHSIATMCGSTKNVISCYVACLKRCVHVLSEQSGVQVLEAGSTFLLRYKVVDIGGTSVSEMRSSMSAEVQQLYSFPLVTLVQDSAMEVIWPGWSITGHPETPTTYDK